MKEQNYFRWNLPLRKATQRGHTANIRRRAQEQQLWDSSPSTLKGNLPGTSSSFLKNSALNSLIHGEYSFRFPGSSWFLFIFERREVTIASNTLSFISNSSEPPLPKWWSKSFPKAWGSFIERNPVNTVLATSPRTPKWYLPIYTHSFIWAPKIHQSSFHSSSFFCHYF